MKRRIRNRPAVQDGFREHLPFFVVAIDSNNEIIDLDGQATATEDLTLQPRRVRASLPRSVSHQPHGRAGCTLLTGRRSDRRSAAAAADR